VRNWHDPVVYSTKQPVVCPDFSLASGLGHQLVVRLTGVEAKLDALMAVLGSKDEAEWIDRKTACSLLNVSDRHLYDLIARGVIRSDAFRNVGTVKKPRYRFHRAKLLNQYHRRA
jgi:excisionase family DNA binding protein